MSTILWVKFPQIFSCKNFNNHVEISPQKQSDDGSNTSFVFPQSRVAAPRWDGCHQRERFYEFLIFILRLFQSNADKVQFVVMRCSRPQTPDLIRSTSKDCIAESILTECQKPAEGQGGRASRLCKERAVNVQKVSWLHVTLISVQ